MKAILSADRKWGLGYQGRLLVSIPSDSAVSSVKLRWDTLS